MSKKIIAFLGVVSIVAVIAVFDLTSVSADGSVDADEVAASAVAEQDVCDPVPADAYAFGGDNDTEWICIEGIRCSSDWECGANGWCAGTRCTCD